jgi:hypothetical protein
MGPNTTYKDNFFELCNFIGGCKKMGDQNVAKFKNTLKDITRVCYNMLTLCLGVIEPKFCSHQAYNIFML